MRLPWLRRSRREPRSRGQSTYVELRTALLSSDPAEFGIAPTPSLQQAWAAVLEMRFGPDVASLVVVADGTVSLYTSRGGGVIGAGEHERVRAAGRLFLESAEASIHLFEPRASFPSPMPERLGFIVLTYTQKLGADVPEAEVRAGTHGLSRCYAAAQEVITQLRLSTPS